MNRPNSRRRRQRIKPVLTQLPWREVKNLYRPIEVLDEEGIERIHDASMTTLEEIGMDFLHPEALDILRRGGAEVESGTQRVRFDRDLIAEQIRHAPAEFTQFARNPEKNLVYGANRINYALVASAPNVSDIDGGRRDGNFKDYCDLVRLGQALNIIHLYGGYPVEPVDLAPATRHLDCVHAFATLSDKNFHGYSLGRTRILDAIEIARIARGIDEAQLYAEPSIFSIINTSSPLRLDGPMIEGIIELAKRRQIVVITPFTLSGAMSPATIVGALVQQNAEALAGIAFTQMINPGTPCIYGGFTSNVDMKSGAPAFGTPEYTRAAMAGGQLARHYSLPYRSSNANASNAVDVQAAYESEMSLWGAVMGHANMVMHAAGWMEGGLCASLEKVIIDAELLQSISEFLLPLEVNDDTLALDAVREVGPGGHFFGAAHTLERYSDAFYSPMLSDWRNFESWQEAGAIETTRRANHLYKDILENFEPPPMAEGIREELDEFVARRKREGGAISS